MRRALKIGGLLFAWVLTGSCGWLVGNWTGGYRERHARYFHEHDLLAPVLAGDPAFAELKLTEATGPGGGIVLVGKLQSRPVRDRVRAELVRLFGESRADELLGGPFVVVMAGPDPKRP